MVHAAAVNGSATADIYSVSHAPLGSGQRVSMCENGMCSPCYN
jgi:hypothetical protein